MPGELHQKQKLEFQNQARFRKKPSAKNQKNQAVRFFREAAQPGHRLPPQILQKEQAVTTRGELLPAKLQHQQVAGGHPRGVDGVFDEAIPAESEKHHKQYH